MIEIRACTPDDAAAVASGLSDPFRARGAEPLQNPEATLCAWIDAAGIRAGTKIPSSALRRPDRYAHRNGRSRIDP
jgi:hypothetical protein